MSVVIFEAQDANMQVTSFKSKFDGICLQVDVNGTGDLGTTVLNEADARKLWRSLATWLDFIDAEYKRGSHD